MSDLFQEVFSDFVYIPCTYGHEQVTTLAVFTEICFNGCKIAYITGRFASLGNAFCQLCRTDSAVVCFSGSENIRNDDFVRITERFPKFIKEETGTGESMGLEHTPCGVLLPEPL